MKPFADYEIQPGEKHTPTRSWMNLSAMKLNQHITLAEPAALGRKLTRSLWSARIVKIGTDNLFCADSSLFPRITNGNLNAPSIMTGEKAADHILGRTILPSVNYDRLSTPLEDKQLELTCIL